MIIKELFISSSFLLDFARSRSRDAMECAPLFVAQTLRCTHARFSHSRCRPSCHRPEDVAVAVSALVFFTAAPTKHRTLRVLHQGGRFGGQGRGEEVCGVCDSSGVTSGSVCVSDGPSRSASPAVLLRGVAGIKNGITNRTRGSGEQGGVGLTAFS